MGYHGPSSLNRPPPRLEQPGPALTTHGKQMILKRCALGDGTGRPPAVGSSGGDCLEGPTATSSQRKPPPTSVQPQDDGVRGGAPLGLHEPVVKVAVVGLVHVDVARVHGEGAVPARAVGRQGCRAEPTNRRQQTEARPLHGARAGHTNHAGLDRPCPPTSLGEM